MSNDKEELLRRGDEIHRTVILTLRNRKWRVSYVGRFLGTYDKPLKAIMTKALAQIWED